MFWVIVTSHRDVTGLMIRIRGITLNLNDRTGIFTVVNDYNSACMAMSQN